MLKNKIPIKIIVIGFVFLFIGALVIQSTGCFNNEQSNNISTHSVNYSSQSESNQNEINDNSKQSLNEKNDDVDEASKLVISKFIDKTKQRYPELTKVGKDMGLNKQSILNIIEKLGCEKTIKEYISFFSTIFNI